MRSMYVLGAAAALAVVLAVAWSGRGPVAAQEKPGRPVQKWEYKVETVNTVGLFQEQPRFNRLGAEGWELCATERNGEKEGVTFIIFKRPKH